MHRTRSTTERSSVAVASAIFGLLNGRFLHPANLSLVVQQVAVVGALGVGQTLIILTAGIDLSVGAIMILAQSVMAQLAFSHNVPGPLVLVIGLAVGAAAGGVNGALVARLKLPPFVATLGMFGIARGLAVWLAGRTTLAFPLNGTPRWVGTLASVQSEFTNPGLWSLLLLAALTRGGSPTSQSNNGWRLSGSMCTRCSIYSVPLTTPLPCVAEVF